MSTYSTQIDTQQQAQEELYHKKGEKMKPNPKHSQQLVLLSKNGKLYNYKMPKNLYRDISTEATHNHRGINQEIHSRLSRTLDPNYKYKSNRKLLNHVINLCSQEYDPYEWMCFDFNIPGYMLDTINLLHKHHPTLDELNRELNIRLMYTMYDPFYNN